PASGEMTSRLSTFGIIRIRHAPPIMTKNAIRIVLRRMPGTMGTETKRGTHLASLGPFASALKDIQRGRCHDQTDPTSTRRTSRPPDNLKPNAHVDGGVGGQRDCHAGTRRAHRRATCL